MPYLPITAMPPKSVNSLWISTLEARERKGTIMDIIIRYFNINFVLKSGKMLGVKDEKARLAIWGLPAIDTPTLKMGDVAMNCPLSRALKQYRIGRVLLLD